MLKISVIVPVKNEGSSIKALLDSLLAQSKVPDEIVITDGGSTDKTISIIEEYSRKSSFIKLICLPHAFPGKGRNTSIAHSRYDIIASIDAGCMPVKNWLEELIKPFEVDVAVDVVYGMCKPAPKTLLEKCFVLVTESTGFDTSVASIAHKKEVWEKVGGYPEDIGTSEDTIFKSKIRNMGFKTVINYNALVYWQPRSKISDFFKQFYNQSRSTGYLGLWVGFYVRKIIFLLTLTFFAIMGIVKYRSLLFFAVFLYLTWISFTIMKHYDWFRDIKGKIETYLILPVVFMVRDIAQVSGFLSGFIKKARKQLGTRELYEC